MKNALLIIILALVSAAHGYAQSNEDLSGGLVWESEPYMATDPANPQHIVVAWMGSVPLSHLCIKIIATFNGGATWSSPAIIPHVSPTYTSADVSMAFDHTGNIYTTYIDSRQSPDSGAVYVVKSADGGLTWGSPAQVISGFADGTKFPIDRPWLTIGKSTGPAPDTLYITTKPAPFVAPPNRPYFEKSYDGGATWSAWRYIDTTGYLVGNVVQAPMAAPGTDSAGTFHCVYPSYLPSQSIYPQYIMATARPGNTFSYNVVYTSIGASPIDTLAKAGARFICDPTNNKHLALLHIEDLTGDLDVYCTETTDGGITWSPQARVNDDASGNGKMQDLVWANFDENGDLVAAWRDRRNAPGTGYQQPSQVWGTIKWKDSASFSTNFMISDSTAPYDSIYLSGSGNDFMNVAMAQDTLSAVWGDVRTGALNIWFSRRAMRTGVTVVKSIASEPVPAVNIYPDPSQGHLTVEGSYITGILITDLGGRAVFQKTISAEKTLLDLSFLTPGTYIASVNTANGVVSKQIEIK